MEPDLIRKRYILYMTATQTVLGHLGDPA